MIRFGYHNNNYDKFYLFKRPDPSVHKPSDVNNFNTCVSYVADNVQYPLTQSDPRR